MLDFILPQKKSFWSLFTTSEVVVISKRWKSQAAERSNFILIWTKLNIHTVIEEVIGLRFVITVL